jgi:NADP-dependent 3-hydroxy acid dehydrogenase YdfG
MRAPRHVLLTGASSGIGEALALAYAAPNVVLSLSGRDAARLEDVATRCRAQGATVNAVTVNVADAMAMETWINACDRSAPLDLVIANAGISGGTAGTGGESADQTRTIFAINVDGTFNTVLPALALMIPRRQGQIAVMSSLAGFRGMAGAPAYSASKAAVRIWGEGLRPMLAAQGIGLSVICPGFVVSRMTAVNRFPMPFLMTAARAAALIKDGLAQDRGRIAFPWPMLVLAWLLAALPDRLAAALTSRLPAKD